MNLKSVFLFGALVSGALVGAADAAVAVKKAAPVATKEASKTDASASLMGSVLGLVSSVQALSAQQKALTEDCIPTSAEINFVDKTVKEWAMTGATSASEIRLPGNPRPCDNITGSYALNAERADATESTDMCYDTFTGAGNENMVWFGFPKVGKATFCPGGELTCKNKKTVSNMYDIFNLVDFDTQDYTVQEATMAGKLIDKIERCSNSKLSAKKRALWGEFLTNTLSNVGQKTNTGNILQQVTNVSNSGGGLGALSGLGGLATQYLDR
ncbi:MAG: hypothetical protein K2M34_01750 [Alphaproteobacteria bacterium]|nr:hypothetical protein [Alphaproteobacteria bacterium]